MANVFSIKNLSCQYGDNRTVLSIPFLEIPAGKLIFVVGVSGVGKSTFIETLGLMNQTLAGGEVKYYTPEGDAVDLKMLWEKKIVLDEFRREHFSFIFQNTNLMQNFSAGENMLITALLKGKSVINAKTDIINYMKRIHLKEGLFERKVSDLSGGQKQRLAFIRAVSAKFNVVFGDEPTGNLDAYTAHGLMKLFKSILQEDQKTGIIVSHDIDLAVTFADIIIPIEYNRNSDGTEFGSINEQNIFVKGLENSWSQNGRPVNNPKSAVLNFFQHESNE